MDTTDTGRLSGPILLGDVCSELRKQAEPLESFDVHPQAVQIKHDDDGLRVTGFSPGLFSAKGKADRMTTHALRQLSKIARIPFTYLERCPVDMQSEQLNYWVPRTSSGGNRLLKGRVGVESGVIEAWMTNSYREYDPLAMLNDISAHLGDIEVRVARADVSNYGLHLQCYLPHEEWEIDPSRHEALSLNDAKFAVGLSFGDSGIGVRGISMKATVMRLACYNGMVVPVGNGIGIATRHTGDIAPFRAVIPAIFGNVMEHKEAFQDRLLEAASAAVVPDEWHSHWPADDDLRREFRTKHLKPSWVTDDAAKAIAFIMEESYDRTRWGLVNALTEYSQKVEDAEDATQVEEYAGRILWGAASGRTES